MFIAEGGTRAEIHDDAIEVDGSKADDVLEPMRLKLRIIACAITSEADMTVRCHEAIGGRRCSCRNHTCMAPD